MTRTTDSPRVLLEPRHVGALRSILAHNPGASLRKLCPLVASACELPRMNPATLARFIERHELRRVLPKGMALRARRRDPAWQKMLDECGPFLQRLLADPKRWAQFGRDVQAIWRRDDAGAAA
jgi:hypothetical protein